MRSHLDASAASVLIAAAASLAAAPLLAQNAELSRLVRGWSSLAVPGAKVVVKNASTTETRTVSSNGLDSSRVASRTSSPVKSFRIDRQGTVRVATEGGCAA